MKLQKILNTQKFEKEDDIGQIGSLDFRQCGDEHFIFVLTFRSGTTGSTCPLVSVGLTDRISLYRASIPIRGLYTFSLQNNQRQ